MDRRTKLILLIIGSLLLFGAVGWFVVWPTLQPVLPQLGGNQPPALPTDLSPQTPPIGTIGQPEGSSPGKTVVDAPGTVSFMPTPTADTEQIAALARRASVLAERVESGASSDGFANLSDVQLDVSPFLAQTFQEQQTALRQQYPASGALYLTAARRLTAQGESDIISGSVYRVTVDLQVATTDMAKPEGEQETLSYRRATVTFTNNGSAWLASGYTAEPFTP